MPLILDGKKARDSYKSRLIERVGALSCTPTLALVQIGDNRESTIYIEQKKKFGQTIGAHTEHIHLPENATENSISSRILALNRRDDVHGIIIQLPLPAHLDRLSLINLIDPEKDVDGLTDENQRLLEEGTPRHIPATAKGVSLLLDFYGISPAGKKAVVFGRSRLVGHPAAKLLEMKGADVSVCHSKTEDPEKISKTANILVVAVGKPGLIGARHVKEGAVVIDVGINSVSGAKLEEEIPKRKIVGDVDFEAVQSLASAISPVPGGVGPMTVLSLFDNLISSAEKSCPRQR
ncbi:MAG: bifunctional 5,10-methylenetetrahydrofolate dehydrogenase/5,10-methenyltetrahydrofolate cyclohydrolase [Candidatus Taylorbacteria bacterium]|nr:bifunctional 5,10-methylenetetrahydrofolate dehydrogenase/5,10-methenyltetrahydrofolate cyclohydrolase [Candidatus Taylorbacteria bacterium]